MQITQNEWDVSVPVFGCQGRSRSVQIWRRVVFLKKNSAESGTVEIMKKNLGINNTLLQPRHANKRYQTHATLIPKHAKFIIIPVFRCAGISRIEVLRLP
jgi:hypothetical protein